MLFNSYEYIFVFLPLTLALFFLLPALRWRAPAKLLLFAASLVFYGYWNKAYVVLLLSSIVINYFFRALIKGPAGAAKKTLVIALGVFFNLALLFYYKYTYFFFSNFSELTNFTFQLDTIVLPLGISFFTFQQIGYLVDAGKGRTAQAPLLDQGLFVAFFPQLVAGPIVRHDELLPQFNRPSFFKMNSQNMAIGLTLFFLGLFKKVVLADGIAAFANPVFEAARLGGGLAAAEAWCGALAYTFQLYFDFSGYTDMALGAARMFNIRLPLNFDSPYKSASIIEFWRRWHMTLSRFFRDYIYIPLGGNQAGNARKLVNLLVTMALGGLWHGAGWTFVLWGVVHGLYLVINYSWRMAADALGMARGAWGFPGRCLSTLLTFLAVVTAWVLFRAHDLESARQILSAMAGWGSGAPELVAETSQALYFPNGLFQAGHCLIWLAGLFLLVFAAPNSNKLAENFQPGFKTWVFVFFIMALSLTKLLFLGGTSEFLYFDF